MKKISRNKYNFEQIDACDLCGSTTYINFLLVEDRNYQTGEYQYVKCKKCKLVWLLVRPTGKSLQKHYPENYRPYKRYAKTNKLQKLIRLVIKKNKFIAKILIADQLFFWPKGKILDVGSGSGYYLHILKDWGWKVAGLELSKKAVKTVKESGFKDIYQGNMFSQKFPKNSFDVIRYSHVLEHVPSPKKELLKVRSLLKKKGKVLIIVPNIDSIFFKIFKEYWYPLEAPRHFYQFSPKTLTKLLLETKFHDIKINYRQPAHTFLWSIFYRLGLHKSDIRFGYLILPLTIILKFSVFLEKSDVVEVVATKGNE